MTKRDFRVRRQLFKGSIRKHRDFDSFHVAYKERERQRRRAGWMVVLLIGLLVAGLYVWGLMG